MAVYKVSYVVRGSSHPGGIINKDKPPEVGEKFQVGDVDLVILEIVELMPPRGDFYYLHATCEKISKN